MDRTLLERMVGAVVLVLLLVLLAPALLDGGAEGDAERNRPVSADSGKRTEVIILNAPVTATPPPAATNPAVALPTPSSPSLSKAAPKSASSVAPATAAKTTPKAAPKMVVSAGKQPPSGFAVQVGSFSEQQNAASFATQIKGAGFNAFVVRGSAAGGPVYRVYSGPEATRETADKLAGKLKSAGYNVMVVELGGANGG